MNTQKRMQRLVAAGWTQQQIADAVGITQATVSRILSGKFQHPNEEIVLATARVYAEHTLGDAA